MKKRRLAGRTVLFVLAALFAFGFLLPTVLTITNSFMRQGEIQANYGAILPSQDGSQSSAYVSSQANLKFIPDMVSLDQYITVLLRSPDYLLKFWNSVLLTVPIVLLQLAVAALAAYSFSRYPGRWKKLLFFAYIVLMLMPYQVTLVPNYLVADWLGLLGSRLAILFPGIFAPFAVFLLTKFMRRIPSSLIEAARLDGAGEWQIFSRIVLPQCKGVLYSIAILLFIDYWNMVEQPLILLSGTEKQPLSVYLATINVGELGIAFAAAVLYMIPPLLLFLHGEKALVEGISSSGSVKG